MDDLDDAKPGVSVHSEAESKREIADEDPQQPTAFVAMQFNGPAWRDRRYIAISEVLEEAGYRPMRADQIASSGPVVDEVCRQLRDAPLVVIDSTGNSPSVSYEIGYCHGVNRPPDETILLRGDTNIPFNYQHYRHQCYGDLRQLRRLLREFLQVSIPVRPDMYGHCFTFEHSEDYSVGFILHGAAIVFAALQKRRFTGRCECYSNYIDFFHPRGFTVAIVVRFRKLRNDQPDYEWWRSLLADVKEETERFSSRLVFLESNSELGTKAAFCHDLVSNGAAQFVNGKIVKILNDPAESFFTAYQQRKSEILGNRHRLSQTRKPKTGHL